MCGRYTLTVSLSQVLSFFKVSEYERVDWHPRYNVAPSQKVPVIRVCENQRRLDLLRWGLIPSWVPPEPPPERVGYKMINARMESVVRSPAFRRPFAHRRCLIPSDGFYEWKKPAAGRAKGKTPYWFRDSKEPLIAFGGVWEEWRSTKGEVIETFTIITTPATASVRAVHDRMPLVIPPECYDEWLAPDLPLERARALLRPYPHRLDAREVSPLVNSPKNDGPEIVERSGP